jgi:hypothetical protein
MANNYVLSSTFYPLDPEHFERAHEIIEEVGIETAADYSGYEPGTEDYDALEPDIMFQYEPRDDGLWFYAEESLDPDQLAEVISRLQVAFNAEKPFTFSYCFECSKPRVDEFGGGSLAIMPSGEIFHAGEPQDALDKAMREKEYGKVVWMPQDIKDLRPEMSDEEIEDFLKNNSNLIKSRLTEMGYEVILELLND